MLKPMLFSKLAADELINQTQSSSMACVHHRATISGSALSGRGTSIAPLPPQTIQREKTVPSPLQGAELPV